MHKSQTYLKYRESLIELATQRPNRPALAMNANLWLDSKRGIQM